MHVGGAAQRWVGHHTQPCAAVPPLPQPDPGRHRLRGRAEGRPAELRPLLLRLLPFGCLHLRLRSDVLLLRRPLPRLLLALRLLPLLLLALCLCRIGTQATASASASILVLDLHLQGVVELVVRRAAGILVLPTRSSLCAAV